MKNISSLLKTDSLRLAKIKQIRLRQEWKKKCPFVKIRAVNSHEDTNPYLDAISRPRYRHIIGDEKHILISQSIQNGKIIVLEAASLDVIQFLDVSEASDASLKTLWIHAIMDEHALVADVYVPCFDEQQSSNYSR